MRSPGSIRYALESLAAAFVESAVDSNVEMQALGNENLAVAELRDSDPVESLRVGCQVSRLSMEVDLCFLLHSISSLNVLGVSQRFARASEDLGADLAQCVHVFWVAELPVDDVVWILAIWEVRSNVWQINALGHT